jgi:ADP-L-glycero-D-manno-heptose 6-epimerase
MIIVTGAAGFIGSCLVKKLNKSGYRDIVLVDDFSRPDKNLNIRDKIFSLKINREIFFEWFNENHRQVNFVFHLGARTDTTEFDTSVFDKLNLNYSKKLWQQCTEFNIPMVYASSAATYGDGALGYDDTHELVGNLLPLNPYGDSKNNFDKWVLSQDEKPPYWAGLKFFNVYGPNEYHKGRMASVVIHAFKQINATSRMNLFRSHRPDYKDGEQLRDFIYVKDVVDVCFFLMLQKRFSGLYNLGTGQARSFVDLAKATFEAMGREANIGFVDTPEDIRDKYQYFTQANMEKLRAIGYSKPFHSLEDGITDYVTRYLMDGKYY